MPVYIRKNTSFSPPSLENIADIDIEDDFSTDPDQYRDKLPQPYRMINKIIDNVFENSWTIISRTEEKKVKELNKVRPPMYDCAVKIADESQNKATSLCDSVDGRYVFIGVPTGIMVINSLSQEVLCKWDEEKVDITSIKCHLIGVQTYLLVTTDELGVSKLFIFAPDYIFLLKVLNEQESVANKIISSKCEASSEGDYLGLVLENTAKSEIWLEVHRLPRDTWLREMETVISEIKTVAQEQESQTDATDGQNGINQIKLTFPRIIGERRRSSISSHYLKSPTEDSPRRSKKKKRAGSISPRPGTPPPLLTLTPGEKPSPKFTPPSLVLKVPSPPPLAGANNSSLMTALQKVDSGDVIGTGQTHIITGAHLDQRDAMFQHLNEKLMPYLQDEDEKEKEIILPTFHFVGSSRVIPIGLEQPSQQNKPTTLIIWWTGESHLKHYSLLKTSKDPEYKPDAVWPFCNKIKSTAISSCETYLAVGLSNGTIVLWDRYIGIEKGVIRVEPDSHISYLQFLHQSVSPSDISNYPPYKSRVSASLLIQTSKGNQYVYNTAFDNLLTLYAVDEENDDVQVLLSTLTDSPQLILVVSKDGSLLIKDVTNGNNVCQLKLQSPFELTSPWEPVYCFGGGGQMLYVKGSSSTKDDEGGIIDLSSLFVYQLRSFPSLDDYWKQTPREPILNTIHLPLEQRINSLLKYRIAQQPLRKERMQERWKKMKSEMETYLSDNTYKQQLRTVAITPSTYRSTPPPL